MMHKKWKHPNILLNPGKKQKKNLPKPREKLEDGDVNDARKKESEARKIYREAELNAVKNNLLNETRELIAIAEREKAKDFAPKTLQKSKTALQQAEQELTNNRYDTDVARNLAREAMYEAKHARYLTSQLKKVKDKKTSLEELALDWETPLPPDQFFG